MFLKKIYGLFVMVLLFLISCTDELYTSVEGDEDCVYVKIRVCGAVDDFSGKDSRSFPIKENIHIGYGAAFESKTKEVNPSKTFYGRIIQSDSNDKNVFISDFFKVDLLNYTVSPFQAEIRSGIDQKLYIILVHHAEKDVLNDLSTIQRIEDLYKWQMRTIQTEGILSELDNSPLFGSVTGVDIPSSGTPNPINFSLKHAGARLSFELNIDPASSITPVALRIRNIPDVYAVFSQDACYPSFTDESGFVSSGEYSLTGLSSTFEWFLPANVRGRGNNHTGDQTGKIHANAPDNYCTYFELDCLTASKKRIRFTIFPGADALNDYSLKANHGYSVKMNISGFKDDDPRIEITSQEIEMEIVDYGSSGDLLSEIKKIRFFFEGEEKGITSDVIMHETVMHISLSQEILSRLENEREQIRKIELLDSENRPPHFFHTYEGASSDGVPSVAAVAFFLNPEEIKSPYQFSIGFQGLKRVSDGRYLVAAPSNFDHVRRYPSARFEQIDHLDFSAFGYWIPIAYFQGEYHGEGYFIRSLTLNPDLSLYGGLFGHIEHAFIDGVIIDRSCVLSSKAQFMGSLAASTESSQISRSSNHAAIYHAYPTETSDTRHLGGLVGYMSGGMIADCYNTGDIFDLNWNANGNGGGLVGFLKKQSGRLKNSYSVASMWKTGCKSVGGLIGFYAGFNKDNLIHCYTKNGNANRVVGNVSGYYDNLIGEDYGLGPYNNQGFVSTLFCDILNGNPSTGIWSRFPDQRPHLTIEKRQ